MDRNVKPVKAIPTVYNGLQFRSRLEATWAAFFDALGWPWEYEPAMFEGPGWTPDFWVPSQNLLVEVKPVRALQDWSVENPALSYALARVGGPNRSVVFAGISPFVRVIRCEDGADMDLWVVGKSVACEDLSPEAEEALDIEACLITNHPPYRLKTDASPVSVGYWSGGIDEMSLRDGGAIRDGFAHGGYHARAAWTMAKNAVQWRPPRG